MDKRISRTKTENPIYGHPQALPTSQLPTEEDALRYIDKLRLEEQEKLNASHWKLVNKSAIVSRAAQDIVNLWQQAVRDRDKIPVLDVKIVTTRLQRLYEKCRAILRSKQNVVDSMKVDIKKLFDICSCQCQRIDCESIKCKLKSCDGFHLDCKCKVKVPKREIKFLLDQRGDRKLHIGNVDAPVSSQWERSGKRNMMKYKSFETNTSADSNYMNVESKSDASDSESLCNENYKVDKEYMPPTTSESRDKQRNLKKLPKTSEACDRYLISNRAGAAIANAVLIDYGYMTEDDPNLLIAPNKLKDQRRRYRKETLELTKCESDEITSLYFDGKKVGTRMMVQKETGKWHPIIDIQDHYAIIVEPGSEYLTHVTPKKGNAKTIAMEIYNYLKSQNLLEAPIICIGADGTNTNVGADGGCIHFLEILLKRPLHYFICQLHGNELPFRALFYFYDGKPKGPQKWTGPIGKMVTQNVSCLPVIAFQPIKFKDFPQIPDDVVKDLSWDQRYLYNICLSIIDGEISADLANIEPGPACVSRWNTLWSRILRIYVATHQPSKSLLRLSTIIIKFSAPMWFMIKSNPYAIHGPNNVLKTLTYLKNLNTEEKNIAKKSIQRNAFFAHPEQVLLAMCADENELVRKKAVNVIQSIRCRLLSSKNEIQ